MICLPWLPWITGLLGIPGINPDALLSILLMLLVLDRLLYQILDVCKKARLSNMSPVKDEGVSCALCCDRTYGPASQWEQYPCTRRSMGWPIYALIQELTKSSTKGRSTDALLPLFCKFLDALTTNNDGMFANVRPRRLLWLVLGCVVPMRKVMAN